MRPSRNALLIQALALELRARRTQLGITQEELAARAELDRPYISLLEVGRKQPTLSVLLRLASGVDLTLGGLVGRVERRYQALQAAQA